MHVIVRLQGRPVEIQIRTTLQHSWAELSEKMSDVIDPSIKYGGGDVQYQSILTNYALLIADQESFEAELVSERAGLSKLRSQPTLAEEQRSAVITSENNIQAVEERVVAIRQRTLELLQQAINNLAKRR